LAVPETLERNTIELEGHELVLVGTGYTDTALSTSLHVPSIDLVVAGDVAYNDVHPYMEEGDPQTWPKWIAALDKLESLKPRAVIAGHRRPENHDHPRTIADIILVQIPDARVVAGCVASDELGCIVFRRWQDGGTPRALVEATMIKKMG